MYCASSSKAYSVFVIVLLLSKPLPANTEYKVYFFTLKSEKRTGTTLTLSKIQKIDLVSALFIIKSYYKTLILNS